MQQSGMADEVIVAFDPGRNIGFALVDGRGRLLRQAVLAERDLERLELPAGSVLLIGDGTGSGHLAELLARRGRSGLLVDETGSTLEARRLYYQRHPARGLLRLVPPGLRFPAVPLDGYAAWALALRYLQAQPGRQGSGAAGTEKGSRS
jgi:hypothetical protein